MAHYPEDHRVAEAEAMPMAEVVARLDLHGLQKAGHELVGPCPRCGGRDRFGINIRKGTWLCRRCDGKGGGIKLVMFVLGLGFKDALTWLCGERQEISQQERDRRRKLAEDNKRRQDAIAEKMRREAIAAARDDWLKGLPAEDSPVRVYLTLRGMKRDWLPWLPAALRFHPALPFMVKVAKGWTEAHRGPAMLAAIQGPDGRFCGLHRTWLDLNRPKGKAEIVHPLTGEILPAKKVLGSKKGGAIRLTRAAETIVMGEGIETTLTAFVCRSVPNAGYWAGVDLGNMAGRRELGPGLKYAGRPDLSDDEAFVPPIEVKRLIYVQDGDSDQRDTRAKLEAGLRRAMVLRPGLVGSIVYAGDGRDLNDILMQGGNHGEN